MGPDDFQSYLETVLTRLQGIEDAVGAPAEPAAPVTVVAPPADPMPLVVAIGLGVVAVLVAVTALLVTRQTHSVLRSLKPAAAADTQPAPRRAFANLLRRYSEMLGVELVTGRLPNRGESSIDLRVQLETALGRMREPGAAELLDEVGDARDHLIDLAPSRRAAENGLVAMRVEWSIERWAANPRAWLADCREQDRLQRIADRGQLAEAS
jgi:hypothetical protein